VCGSAPEQTSVQLYPLVFPTTGLGVKRCVFAFAPATHPVSGVPTHVLDPAGVPKLQEGQATHDASASEVAPTLLPNVPAGQSPAQAAPNVPPAHLTHGGIAVGSFLNPTAQTHAELSVAPAGLDALAAPHDTQVVLAVSFHHPGGQPELGTQNLFVASHQCVCAAVSQLV
jgi:hypothetical protein